MKTEEINKEVVLTFMNEFLINHNIQILDELLGPNYTQHNPLIPDNKGGLIGFFTEYWKKYTPTYNIKRVIAEGDLVAIHYHYQPVKEEMGMAIVDIFRLENEKLVEHWDVVQHIPETSMNNQPMF
jgi:predicted SnoaL-like aldol condensation-catalyzing enzyme